MALIGKSFAPLLVLVLASGATAQQKLASSSMPPVPPQGKPSSSPVRVRTDVGSFNLDRSPQSPSAHHGQTTAVSRGAETALFPCAPHSGLASSTRPLFLWQASASSAAPVHFSLATADTNVLYEADVPGDRLEYPDSAPPLTPGSAYLWTISRQGVISNPPYYQFEVQDQTAHDKLAEEVAKGATDSLARAQIYLEKSVWYDAVAEIEQGLQKQPNRKDLADQLQALYGQIAPGCSKSTH